MIETQYDEGSQVQNQHMGLRPKANPVLRREASHKAMAAGGDDDDRRHRRDGDDPERSRPPREPETDGDEAEAEDEEDDDDDDDDTEDPEHIFKLRRFSGWLTRGGKRNWQQAGRSS